MKFTKTSYCFVFTCHWHISAADWSHRNKW